MSTLFEKIIAREIPSDVVFEDDQCIVINDINPVAPIHVLIIPKKPIVKLADAEAGDQALLGHLMLVAGEVARQLGVAEGFRLIVNNGEGGGQTIFHLHLHLLAGRDFTESQLAL